MFYRLQPEGLSSYGRKVPICEKIYPNCLSKYHRGMMNLNRSTLYIVMVI
jgi:hypothetical protein